MTLAALRHAGRIGLLMIRLSARLAFVRTQRNTHPSGSRDCRRLPVRGHVFRRHDQSLSSGTACPQVRWMWTLRLQCLGLQENEFARTRSTRAVTSRRGNSRNCSLPNSARRLDHCANWKEACPCLSCRPSRSATTDWSPPRWCRWGDGPARFGSDVRLGQKRTLSQRHSMSALPLKADI